MPGLKQPKRSSHHVPRRPKLGGLNGMIENDLIRRVSPDEYRARIKDVYGGVQGSLLTVASTVSLHIPLGKRLLRTRQFDLRGMTSILDVGSGSGQIAGHLLQYADPKASITCVDLSHPMLCRARHRLKSDRPNFLVADLTNLPFADATFDGVTCGYVLEHVPNATDGLRELARVMCRGGRLLLLATEDSFSGAWTSRIWCCQTFNREALRSLCESLGLLWKRELWFTPLHRVLRAGGICVEIEKL